MEAFNFIVGRSKSEMHAKLIQEKVISIMILK